MNNIQDSLEKAAIAKDLASKLELVKASYFNQKETLKEVNSKFLMETDSLFKEVNSIYEKFNNDFTAIGSDGDILKDPLVFLTESGFSSPIGSFNAVTRVAELTEDIENQTIVITISNFVFKGNGHKINNSQQFLGALFIDEGLTNITIEDFNIINVHFGVSVGANSMDITIKHCTLSIANFAVLAKFTRNLQIKHNKIISNNFGILLLEACSYSYIEKNTFENNLKAIDLSSTV